MRLRIISSFWEEELPKKAADLVQKSKGADAFGDGRAARAEIDVRSSLSLARATNVLAVSTLVLSIATIVLVFVTAIK